MTCLLKRFCTGSLFLLLFLFPRITAAAEYTFVTRWEIAAPLSEVWRIIYDAECWPEWWKGVEVRKVQEGDHTGAGAVLAFAWKAALPYKLHFHMTTDRIVVHDRIEGHADGDLEGTGRWSFQAVNDTVAIVVYHWQVQTTKRWMNRLAFILKPVFRANHNVVMRRGERGLIRALAIS